MTFLLFRFHSGRKSTHTTINSMSTIFKKHSKFSSCNTMVIFLRNSLAVLLCIQNHNAQALQIFGDRNRGSTTPPAPLCERVDLGTLSVSPMGFGTLNLPLDKEIDDDAASVLKTASDCGINFADTAEAVRVVLYRN